MSADLQGKSDLYCFQLFTEDPTQVSETIIEGSHKYIAKIIRDGETGPTVQTLIKIFSAFSKEPIKDYVFNRMTKPILLELALCVIQDLALNGPSRAKTLALELVNTKSGGKVLRIADPFTDETPYDPKFLSQIDEAFFRIKDTEGRSPDVNFAAGQGHKAAYSPFDKHGAFIKPRGLAPRSLDLPIEVFPISH